MSWNLSSDRPIYLQLMEHIEKDIISGRFQPGDRLPSVRELAAEAAVNPNTMQKALQELEAGGLITTQRTSGRTITQEESQISLRRQALAHISTGEYLLQMKGLLYSLEETEHFIKERGKELFS